MILGLVVLLALFGLAVWIFLRTRPDGVSSRALGAWDAGVVVAALAGCAWTTAWFYRTTGQGVDRAWWPVLAALASLLLASAVLLAGALLRALVVRPGRRP